MSGEEGNANGRYSESSFMTSPWISHANGDDRLASEAISDTDDELLPALSFTDDVFKVRLCVD